MLEETATPTCMPFMILFLSELRLALNPLTRGSFPWLLYRGWSVAFSCLMRVTLENSSYRPCSLGTPGLARGLGWSLLKRFTGSGDIRVGVFLGGSAGLTALMERWIHHRLLGNHTLWGWQGPGDLSQWPCDGDAQVLCVQGQTQGVVMEPAGMWGHYLTQPCAPLSTKCTPKGLQTLKIKMY